MRFFYYNFCFKCLQVLLQLCPQNSVYCSFILFHCKIFYHSPLWITSYFELYFLHLNISGFSTFFILSVSILTTLYPDKYFCLICVLVCFMSHSMICIGEYSLHMLKYCLFCCFGVQCSINDIRNKCLIVLFFYMLYILNFFLSSCDIIRNKFYSL